MTARPHRWDATRRRALVAALTALVLLSVLLRATPARAEAPPIAVDRSLAVTAWLYGGAQVRVAAEAALVGSDEQVRAFLDEGWAQAQRIDQRDAVVNVLGESGPAVRAAAQQALAAADGGDQGAISAFLADGWQTAADIDARVSVNQLMASAGPQVREVAQQALDSEDPAVMRTFLDSGWQVQWRTDQRLRVNQAMAMGGPQVRAAGQKALDAGSPEAMEAFLGYGWAVASARDDEAATLTELLAQAQAAGEVAAQETQQATQEADRAKASAEAAKKAAEEAAAATEAARDNTAQAAAHARRAAVAADKAAQAAQVAVQAAAAASRAARAAASAAAKAASAAAKAGQAAAKARGVAAWAARFGSWAGPARTAAEEAREIAERTRDFAENADQAGKAVQANNTAVAAAKAAALFAKAAADANEEAAEHAYAAGAETAEAVAAAQRARANAERALRAVQAAEKYLQTAIAATFAARDAALRAADNADAAALAAIEAADHAGEAAYAASRATEHANAATVAAQAALDTVNLAVAVFDAAREADAERLAVLRDQGVEAAQVANVEYEAQQRQVNWDVAQSAKRDAQTNQLLAVAQNPATPTAEAVAAARRVALALAQGPGAWTQEAARTALAADDAGVLEFARTEIVAAAARDDRHAVMNLAVSDNTALTTAANTALAGSDATVRQFLLTQNYPGRYTQDRLKVNQILATANSVGDVVLAQAAQTALNAETLQALRDFLDNGQYTAAATGQRVMVNQIAAAGGPEVKAAAQIALDGPPVGLREFLNTGQYTAAERDHEQAAHLAVVGGMLEKINQIAATAVQHSLEAHAVAAQARNDAAQAADYAEQAQESANEAAGHAIQATVYAAQATQSVDKAAAAVNTAKAAATRANASVRSAVRSATWAVLSHEAAVKAANDARVAAMEAEAWARVAGLDAEAAHVAAKAAHTQYMDARAREVVVCSREYTTDFALKWQEFLDPTGDANRDCVENIIGKPEALARRAYTNAAFCGYYPDGSRLYQNCMHSTLDPAFRMMQSLVALSEYARSMTAVFLPAAAGFAGLCIATLACGAAAGALLTITDVGVNIVKLINGDQTLGQTLLNLSQAALESLILFGVGKALVAGFRSLQVLYVAIQNAKKAAAEIKAADLGRLQLLKTTWMRGCVNGSNSFVAGTPVLLADGGARAIEDIRVGDQVLATDPLTDVTRPRPVTGTITGTGQKHLVDITVTDGGDESLITATDRHPFWVPDREQWVDAGELRPGNWLRTGSGAWTQVSAVGLRTERTTVHNLTVADDHTYYVLAGQTSLLVHNTSGCGSIALGKQQVGDDDIALNVFAMERGALMYRDWTGSGPWYQQLLGFIQDGVTKIHVNLDGIDDPIAYAASGRDVDATDPLGQGFTRWEMYQLSIHPEAWDRITWYRKGKPDANPFA
ncbi:polymorphic toxin-type HINT domain-containing protein [Catellatospora sichuanensis]|uniref:polymorphic toxin-type HINT domain-containing protein n=1 Tax=Catellatospora sichuanensis TaxID=1969805 RepID=UPI0016433806|nr:polymorphic toxin-type HINT domain-containing protein [Catellatospora sichuanensis]